MPDATLAELIAGYKAEGVMFDSMTREQRRDFIVSFAYGNIKLHNPAVTREMMEREYDKLEGRNA